MAKTNRETSRGFASAQNAAEALTNTAVETTMYSQLIGGGKMGTNKEMNFKFICLLTTGLVAPSLTVRVKLGSSSIAVVNSLAIAVSQTDRPFIVEGSIINEDAANNQLVWAKITQYATSLPLVLSSGGAMSAADWTEDTSSDKTFSVTAQFGSAVAGTSLTFRHASIDLT